MASPPTRAAGATFRLFVSSTFEDLREERNALQERVFPRLRELCRQHGSRFQAIDLRWGISEESGLDHQTMKICLDELDRCRRVTPRPNFLVLLGDRYGWQPLPAEIPEAEFGPIRSNISPTEAALLEAYYLPDDNAVPPVRCLRPRNVETASDATQTDRESARRVEGEVWRRTERELRHVLEKAVADLPLDEAAKTKYTASATEQEILRGALQVPDAAEHVSCFFRTIRGLPLDERARGLIDLDDEGRVESESRARLQHLKDMLRQALPGCVRDYEGTWSTDRVTPGHLDVFCDEVFRRLSQLILRQIEGVKKMDPLEQEVADHRTFGDERANAFTGRREILERVESYLSGRKRRAPLAVIGTSGSGKTALMAHVARLAQNRSPAPRVVVRFIGATPASGEGRGLLAGLCEEIARGYGDLDYRPPSDHHILIEEFGRQLRLAEHQRPLVVLLDGLDQLRPGDPARGLVWLPAHLPPNVWLCVSSVVGDRADALRRKLTAADLVELTPMPAIEGADLLDRWLENAGRTLTSTQREHVLTAFGAVGLPLHLKLAFEDARRWKSYDQPTPIPADVLGLIDALFDRLSAARNHGVMLVSRSIGLLAAARHGLTEDEMLDLLAADPDVIAEFRSRARHEHVQDRLPVIVWSRLYWDLGSFLTERRADGTSVIAFYHRQLAEVASRRFIAGRHVALATYFAAQPHWSGDDRGAPNVRRCAELPYQQSLASMLEELLRTLTDLDFIEEKCAAGLTDDLVHDYQTMADASPHQPQSTPASGGLRGLARLPERARLFADFVAAHAHIFARDSTQVVPFAHNYAADGPVVDEADLRLGHGAWRRNPWIEILDRPPLIRRPALLRTFEGHRGAVTAIAVARDRRVAVSGSKDGTLRIWDLESSTCTRIIEAHVGGVNDVAMTADAQLVVTAGADGQLAVWDLNSGERRGRLAGHDGAVLCVAVEPQGAYAVSGGEDGTVRVWELTLSPVLELGPQRTLTAHFGPVTGIACSGRNAISCGFDHALLVWDVADGTLVSGLAGHASPAQGVAVSDDFSTIVSCSGFPPGSGGNDETRAEVRFWQSSETVFVSHDHRRIIQGDRAAGLSSDIVEDVAVTPDGRLAVSVGFDRTVRVWDVRERASRVLIGHTDEVRCVAIDAAGSIAVTGSADRTVRVWDLAGESTPERRLERRFGRVGAGARTGLMEKASLVWANWRVRDRVLYNGLVAGLIALLMWTLHETLPQAFASSGRTLQISAEWNSPSAWFALALVGLLFWQSTYVVMMFVVAWRRALRGDPLEWKRAAPLLLRFSASVLTLPAAVWFKVTACPVCGQRMAGRPRFFHCLHCATTDRRSAIEFWTSTSLGRSGLQMSARMTECRCLCGHLVRVPFTLSGRSGRCPSCGSLLRLPGSGGTHSRRVFDVPNLLSTLVEYASALNLSPPGSDYSAAQVRTYVPTTLFLYMPVAVALTLSDALNDVLDATILSGSHAALLAVAMTSLCAVPVASAYRRFAGTSYETDRVSFALAGGFDVITWIPLSLLSATAIAVWLERDHRASWMIAGDNLWRLALAAVVVAMSASALAARGIFRTRFGESQRPTATRSWREWLLPAWETLSYSPLHYVAAALLVVSLLRIAPLDRVSIDAETAELLAKAATFVLFLRLVPFVLGGAKPLHGIRRGIGRWWANRHRRRAAGDLFRKLVMGQDIAREIKILEQTLSEANLDWLHLEALLWHRILSVIANDPTMEAQSIERLHRYTESASRCSEGEQVAREYEYWLATAGAQLSQYPALSRLLADFPRPDRFRPPAPASTQ